MEESVQNTVVDQSVLANDVSNKIKYEFLDKFLVKPLDPIKVKKEFSSPVSDKPAKKDADGVEAVDYEEVKTEIKEVDSDYRKGIVLKVPMSHSNSLKDQSVAKYTSEIKVGDVVIFRDRSSEFFDLIKDSRLVTYFNIVAIEK